MSYECDVAELYEKQRRRARKDHICSACREKIPLGHFYWTVSILYEGCWDRYKRCLRCERIHGHLVELCRELHAYGRWPSERLSCGKEYREEWEFDPPEDIEALAFVTPEQMQEMETK